jgi:hypothetical protein
MDGKPARVAIVEAQPLPDYPRTEGWLQVFRSAKQLKQGGR